MTISPFMFGCCLGAAFGFGGWLTTHILNRIYRKALDDFEAKCKTIIHNHRDSAIKNLHDFMETTTNQINKQIRERHLQIMELPKIDISKTSDN